MAKINLTTQQNQENLRALASGGVLICMIVTVVGIKLWWFKHRLSFEQKNAPNSSDRGSTTPAVLVPRRTKQPIYKKDKRYSQQIYESAEVYGVFRQKHEDEFEIQRPAQLPPVRMRPTSESDTFVIRAPPRTKRRDQVHSTAFEDLEVATPPALATASSSELSIIPEINTKITLTFEEFERQFNLKELKAGQVQATTTTHNEVNERPQPPLRLNRSCCTRPKPKKHERLLKLSQSITMQEFPQVTEKRPVGHASPKEDLSRLDFDEKAKMFEDIARPKATASAGYIKYEEVDNDLHERELNNVADKPDHNFIDSGFYESPLTATAPQALRNESLICNNDLNASPSVHSAKEFDIYGKPCRTNDWQAVDFRTTKLIMKTNDANNTFHLNNSIYYDNKEKNLHEFEKASAGLERDSANFEKNAHNNAKHFVDKQQANEFIKDSHQEQENALMMVNTNPEINFPNGPQTDLEYELKNQSVGDKKSPKLNHKSGPISDTNESLQHYADDFDSQLESWPQFEEKIESPQVTVRRFNHPDLQPQTSFDENDLSEASSIYSSTNENRSDATAGVSLKERRPTVYALCRPASPEFENIEEWQKAFNNKFYNQVRSLATAEESLANLAGREVSFAASVRQQIENKGDKTSAIKQRRPTGYIQHSEHFLISNDESDQETNDYNVSSNLNGNAGHLPRVKFEDRNFGLEHETEKFTLNQRRPTGFVRLLNSNEEEGISESQVTFNEASVFKDAEEMERFLITQRRPTGFIRNLEMLDLSDNETAESLPKECDKNNDLKTEQVSQNCCSARFQETEHDFETTAEPGVKQRRPTGYGQQEVLFALEKQVSFQLDIENNGTSSQQNEALRQRRPTGFIKKDEITKQVNFQLKQEDEKSEYVDEQLKQRRPTGFVSREELKCLDQPAPIYRPSSADNQDFDKDLWQELEKDVAQDVIHNFEEEFAKIRHSYELNEADFLETADELKKSPLGFGKSIEDDWENFEKLKNQVVIKPSPMPEEEIKITFSDADLTSTTSILKDAKLEEETQSKPRKSKVTFDFKTAERVIPARKGRNYSAEDTDFDDEDAEDECNKCPPQPVKRSSNIKYNNEKTLTPIVAAPQPITQFGSQIGTESNEVADSWSAIRKHRNLTKELQHFSTDSSHRLQPTSAKITPKPAYRNPMAQLALQRAKEVRADMDGFKSRSINSRKPEASSRRKQKLLNLSNVDHAEGTEA